MLLFYVNWWFDVFFRREIECKKNGQNKIKPLFSIIIQIPWTNTFKANKKSDWHSKRVSRARFTMTYNTIYQLLSEWPFQISEIFCQMKENWLRTELLVGLRKHECLLFYSFFFSFQIDLGSCKVLYDKVQHLELIWNTIFSGNLAFRFWHIRSLRFQWLDNDLQWWLKIWPRLHKQSRLRQQYSNTSSI